VKTIRIGVASGMVELEEGKRTRGRAALVPKVSFDRITPPAIN